MYKSPPGREGMSVENQAKEQHKSRMGRNIRHVYFKPMNGKYIVPHGTE